MAEDDNRTRARGMGYKGKRAELLAYLAEAGWDVQLKNARTGDDLKVPYATLKASADLNGQPREAIRLNFRRQAVYQGEHPLVEDTKLVTGPELVALALKRAAS